MTPNKNANLRPLQKELFEKYNDWFMSNFRTKHPSDSDAVRLNEVPMRQLNNLTYKTYFSQTGKRPSDTGFNSLSTPLQYMANYVNYIPMGPRRAETHKKTYIVKKGKSNINLLSDLTNNHKPVINTHDKDIETIMKHWMAKAINLAKSNPVTFKDVRDSIYVLVGKPGVGKTAFLNYCFSVYARQMIKDHIIWIRVNLNNVSKRESDLKNRLLVKFIRKFTQYYAWNEKRNFGPNIMTKLKKYIEDTLRELHVDDENIAAVVESKTRNFMLLIKTIGIYEKEKKTYELKPLLKQSKIAEIEFYLLVEKIIEFSQKKNQYGLIFMFDGLDNVTLDHIQHEVYKSWVDSIFDIAKNEVNSSYHAIYLITTRLFSYLDKIEEQINQKVDKSHICIANIDGHNFARILAGRFDYAYACMKRDHPSRTETAAEFRQVCKNIICIIEMCARGKYATGHLSDCCVNGQITNNKFRLFSRITNNSCRSAMRLIRSIILALGNALDNNTHSAYDILSDHKGVYLESNMAGKEWRVYRLLIHGNIENEVYSSRIKYKQETGDSYLETDYRGIIHNIFNYNNVNIIKHKSPISRMLLKWHALAILEREEKEKGDEGPPWLSTLVLKLRKLYDKTDKERIYKDVKELIYNGLIYPVYGNDDQVEAPKDDHYKNYRVAMTSAGKYIKNNIVRHFIYWETICDDIPMERSYIINARAVHHRDKKIGMHQYLAIKSCSIYLLFKIAGAIEDYLVSRYEYSVTRGAYKRDGLMLVTDGFKSSVFNGMLKSWEGVYGELTAELQDTFIDYLKELMHAE